MTPDIPALKKLWQQAFEDEPAFLEKFFTYGFSPRRFRCIYRQTQLAAALYWFDCQYRNKKIAYLYGVATEKSLQNQGYCRRLMAETHEHLKNNGYAGAILVPGSPELAPMYRKFGYRDCCKVTKKEIFPGGEASPEELTPEQYAQIRLALLPPGSPQPDRTAFRFLSSFCRFYRTGSGIFCVDEAGGFQEFLGDAGCLPGIVRSLELPSATVPLPGEEPFALFYPLEENLPAPDYFALPMN